MPILCLRYAGFRNMSSPESSPESVRQRLTDLRNGLLHLHKTLLDSETAVYDHDIARITSKGQLLDLVLHDPWFAWLQPLSQLVVSIDEALDGKEPLTSVMVESALKQARLLLTPSEEGEGFARHYFDALQRDPNVVMEHGEVVKMLGKAKQGMKD